MLVQQLSVAVQVHHRSSSRRFVLVQVLAVVAEVDSPQYSVHIRLSLMC